MFGSCEADITGCEKRGGNVFVIDFLHDFHVSRGSIVCVRFSFKLFSHFFCLPVNQYE